MRLSNFETTLKASHFGMKASHRLCLLLVGLSFPLIAQQPSEPSAAPPQITLDVVVSDKSGKPQAGLQQQDFTLLDNKSPQKIMSFQAIDEPGSPAVPPVEVVIVIDTVNTSPQTVANELLQVQKYLRKNDGKLAHPTSIIIFSDSGLKNLGNSTLDGNSLSTLLAGKDVTGLHSMLQASGENGDFERLTSSISKLYSLAAFEAVKPGKKIVIWLSPGWPLLRNAGQQMYSNGKDQLFQTLVKVSTALREARITLYSIDPEGASGGGFGRLESQDRTSRDRFAYESFLKGIPSGKEMMPPNLALQVLVTRSGGRVLTTGNDIPSQIEDCVSDTKAFYVLSFEAIPTEHPNDYHNLELKLDKPGLTARTSAGYYAQPDQRPGASQEKKK
jgi:VWFA-related protein